jgi:hypothetical protein
MIGAMVAGAGLHVLGAACCLFGRGVHREESAKLIAEQNENGHARGRRTWPPSLQPSALVPLAAIWTGPPRKLSRLNLF